MAVDDVTRHLARSGTYLVVSGPLTAAKFITICDRIKVSPRMASLYRQLAVPAGARRKPSVYRQLSVPSAVR